MMSRFRASQSGLYQGFQNGEMAKRYKYLIYPVFVVLKA